MDIDDLIVPVVTTGGGASAPSPPNLQLVRRPVDNPAELVIRPVTAQGEIQAALERARAPYKYVPPAVKLVDPVAEMAQQFAEAEQRRSMRLAEARLEAARKAALETSSRVIYLYSPIDGTTIKRRCGVDNHLGAVED